MAVVLENSNLVKQKIKIALGNADPVHQDTFNDLVRYLATQGGNPDLQFVAFSAEQATTNTGTDLTAAACKVYGWYAKARRTTGTTSSFVSIHAEATNGATTSTLVTARFKAVNQNVSQVMPRGLACETGLTISAATAVGGATESSAADAADGFIIIGAA